MLENIGTIRKYTSDIVDSEAFYGNDLVQSAVLMQLLVMGELAKSVPEEARSTIDIPWSQICGLRNRVAHEYYKIDLETVWKIVTEELTSMEAPLSAYLVEHPIPSE